MGGWFYKCVSLALYIGGRCDLCDVGGGLSTMVEGGLALKQMGG